jgi:hypothetical protein
VVYPWSVSPVGRGAGIVYRARVERMTRVRIQAQMDLPDRRAVITCAVSGR